MWAEVAREAQHDAEHGLRAQAHGHDRAAPHDGGELVGHEVVERLLEGPRGQQRKDGGIHAVTCPSLRAGGDGEARRDDGAAGAATCGRRRSQEETDPAAKRRRAAGSVHQRAWA